MRGLCGVVSCVTLAIEAMREEQLMGYQLGREKYVPSLSQLITGGMEEGRWGEGWREGMEGGGMEEGRWGEGWREGVEGRGGGRKGALQFKCKFCHILHMEYV